MNDQTDSQLLREYAERRSEAAFAELVRRHIDLVHSAALRMVGDSHLAQDLTQGTFVALSQNAGQLIQHPVLSGWLHRTARNLAANAVRSDIRRQTREQQAVAMNELLSAETDAPWERIAPHLDAALGELSEDERDVLLLRFFEKKSALEIGGRLGISAEAAQKRVSRAVERLREFFAKRGVTVGASGLAVVLSANAVQAAPVGLVTRISKSSAVPALSGVRQPVAPFRVGPPRSVIQFAAVFALVSFLAVPISRLVSKPELAKSQNDMAAESKSNDGSIVSSSNNSSRKYGSVTLARRAEVPKAIRQWVTVVDASNGNRLPNVHIRAAYFYAGGRGEGHSVYTDNDGVAGIPEPNERGAGPGMNVFIVKEGYVPKAIRIDLDTAPEYVMKLDPAVVAKGVVVDEDGYPVVGVRIEAIPLERHEMGKPNTDFQLTRVETDSEGRWSYHHIPRNYSEANFKLTCDGYAVTQVSLPMNGPESQNARFVIKRGHVVYGQVFDEVGSRVFGATVSEVHNFGHRKLRAETDANGVFLMAGLSGDDERKALLRVEVFGKASHLQTVQLHDRTNIVRIVLGQGNVFRGQVIDEGGRPVSGAVVQTDFDFARQIEKRFEWQTETDANGRFEWNSAPEEPVCYWIEANGYEVIRGLRKPADGTLHRIELKARR